MVVSLPFNEMKRELTEPNRKYKESVLVVQSHRKKSLPFGKEWEGVPSAGLPLCSVKCPGQ